MVGVWMTCSCGFEQNMMPMSATGEDTVLMLIEVGFADARPAWSAHWPALPPLDTEPPKA